ncbi:hypothetical protein EJ08DRAFT_187091 [Tothia fuscella]|uniref:Uncharacterized protein n=1 Tax=Tothia fuscella TaxID=1048955 RepID=A0A9P4TZ78_9PEZI|nr:hypothetical protein EJ08DRAFT_187091 [Tothia fuscella]
MTIQDEIDAIEAGKHSAPPPWEDPIARQKAETSKKIQAVIDSTNDFATQVDAIAALRGWFRLENIGSCPIIKSYMSGNLDVDTAVTQLSEPINECYTTANYGRQFRDAEQVAANQRKFYDADEARERWGDPLPEDPMPVIDDSAPDDSVEGLLWQLWFSILHVGKCTPYTDVAAQSKLLDLVEALKKLEDPPPPQNMTKALSHDWIWSTGKVWSNLNMLGPSTREMWNDMPHEKTITVPEIKAWANVNALVAGFVARGIADFWIYCIWAMRSALEDVPLVKDLDSFVPAAAAWISVLGRQLYDRNEDLTSKDPKRQGNPGAGGKVYKGPTAFCRERWDFWTQAFQDISERQDVKQTTREAADRAAKEMIVVEEEEKESTKSTHFSIE